MGSAVEGWVFVSGCRLRSGESSKGREWGIKVWEGKQNFALKKKWLTGRVAYFPWY